MDRLVSVLHCIGVAKISMHRARILDVGLAQNHVVGRKDQVRFRAFCHIEDSHDADKYAHDPIGDSSYLIFGKCTFSV